MARMAVKEARRRRSEPTAGARPSAEAIAGAAQFACVLEACAEKPGNITPRHDFADTSYEDMLRSAIALGPELGRAAERGVGDTVLAAVRAAGAGGLDEPVEQDVRAAPTVALRDAMAAAAGRDSVAAEYATGYAVTFELGLPALVRALDDGLRPRPATVELYLGLLAAIPDTLVARKRGRRTAERVSVDAARVLAAGGVRSDAGRAAMAAFDASLRRDGNALNPGTTADLVTAVLFVALLEGLL